MKISVYKDYDEMSKAAADLVVNQVRSNPRSLLSLPSGDTPTGMLAYLVQYVQEGKLDLTQCFFVGLDEWLGLDENMEGSCKHYMYSNLFTPAKIQSEKIVFFDALETDVEQDCERINNFIDERGGIDLMLVGIGMNGHIGFNEPGTDFDSYAHQSTLDGVTTKVGQKYFKEQVTLQSGITLGLRHLKEAKTAVLIASGKNKEEIVAAAMEGPVSADVPASIFQLLPTAQVLLDEDAAALLKKLPIEGR
jgi:glucosamine-6-phosphate deaminase